jgi:hypothetical protein
MTKKSEKKPAAAAVGRASKRPEPQAVAEAISAARTLPDGGAEVLEGIETFPEYRARMIALSDDARTAEAVAYRATGSFANVPESRKITIRRYDELLERVGGDASKIQLGEYVELGYPLETAEVFHAAQFSPAMVSAAGGDGGDSLKRAITRYKRRHAKD